MPFSPSIDNYIFHEQPYKQLMNGDYNKTVDIISGSVQHETEIFIRAIFSQPISGLIYQATLFLLIKVYNEMQIF